MLRAARKAAAKVDAKRIEDLGRRALKGVESIDRRLVQDLGMKAARGLDPRRIEEIAEEAGRDLLGVVERVAERIEGVVSPRRQARRDPADKEDGPEDGESTAAAPDGEGGDPADPRHKQRVRVDG